MSLCLDDLIDLHRVTYSRRPIDTINSPDDGHIAVRNMYRIEINIHGKELCVKFVTYKDFSTELVSILNSLCCVARLLGFADCAKEHKLM